MSWTLYCGEVMAGWVDGDCAVARFSGAKSLTLLSGSLYVADTNNAIIRVVDTTAG